MSYCRFSSDNDKSDVYCYASTDGWHVHVAANRRTKNIDMKKQQSWEEYFAELSKVTVPIDLPYAGEELVEPTRKSTLERLFSLRALGYHIPQSAINRLREEIKQFET